MPVCIPNVFSAWMAAPLFFPLDDSYAYVKTQLKGLF